MSYAGYLYYPQHPTSRPAHAGLELLLGAAEHLESASQSQEQVARLPFVRHAMPSRRSIAGVFSKSTARDGHPFSRSPENPRLTQDSDSYDPGESDKVRSSNPIPFRTRTRGQRQSDETKSASWPGAPSSSSLSSDADLDLFVPADSTTSTSSSHLRAVSRTLKDRLEHRITSHPPPSSSTTTRPTMKRAQTAVSCIRCRSTHKKCDEQRPCKRCVRVGRGDCEDAPPRGVKLKTSYPNSNERELFEDLDIDVTLRYLSRSPGPLFPSASHPFLDS